MAKFKLYTFIWRCHFFDWDYDNDPDHVGIVEKVENKKIYTIEGNSNDRCRNKVYDLKSKCIFGHSENKKVIDKLICQLPLTDLEIVY